MKGTKICKSQEGPANSVIYYDVEYEKLLDAMKKHEGWREGKEEYIEVKKIIEFALIKNASFLSFLWDSVVNSWISKQEAIALAENGRLHAIIVHGKNETYLRPNIIRLGSRIWYV